MSKAKRLACAKCGSRKWCDCPIDEDFSNGKPSPKSRPNLKKARAYAKVLLSGPPAHRNLALAFIEIDQKNLKRLGREKNG